MQRARTVDDARPRTASCIDQSPAGGREPQQGLDGHDRRRPLRPPLEPGADPRPPAPDADRDAGADRREGRRPRRRALSEHDVSLAPARRARGLAAAGHEVLDVRIARDGAWSRDGDDARAASRAAACSAPTSSSRCCTARSARTARCRACSSCSTCPYVGAGVLASALCMDKVVFKEVLARGRRAAGRLRRPCASRAGARAGAVRAELACSACRCSSSRPGSARRSGSPRSRTAGRARRRARGRRSRTTRWSSSRRSRDGMEVECSVLGNGEPEASRPGEIVARRGRLVRLRGQVQPGGDGARRPGADLATRAPSACAARASRRSCASAARASPASTSSSRASACSSTSSTRCPGFTPTSVYPKLWEATGVRVPRAASTACSARARAPRRRARRPRF